MHARTPRLYAPLAFLLLTTAPIAAMAQSTSPPAVAPTESTISATGTGRVERAPDFVDVSIGIESQEKSAAAAQSKSESVMKASIAAIGRLSLAGQELQTGAVQLSPRYDNRPYTEGPRDVIGYSATIMVRVRTTDLGSVARIIDAALEAGANRIDWVQFGIKEAIAAREEAIKLATQAAVRKARVMAEALDVRLGRVIEANTLQQQNFGWGSANRMSNMVAPAGPGGPGEPAGDDQSPVVPGKVEVWAEVTVRFGALDHGK